MLRNSLTNCVTTRAQGNACVLHLLAGILFGIVLILCGLTAILCQITQHPRSEVCVSWLGRSYMWSCAVIGCMHGVCIIVWMFGTGDS